MAQYNKLTSQYVDRNNDLFDVKMVADADGNIASTATPLPVTLGSDNITINGNITIPATVTTAQHAYATDAWTRPKTIIDHSLFSATWTFGIPSRVWEEYQFDGSTWTPQATFSRGSEQNKMLSVVSGTVATNGTTVATKKYIRYQPNRGQLYSTAVIMPNATANGIRRFGMATPQDGVFFEMVGDGSNWDIFAGRRSYGSLSNYVSIKSAILALFPSFDPSKGNVYDIQYQWRGVGNYTFFVNLEPVYVEEYLGTGTQLSMSDPALQPFYSAYSGDGTEVELLSGCVDVSSEGGAINESTLFGTIGTGDTLLSTSNTANVDNAVLAVYVPRTAGNGAFNSRGAFLDKLVTWTNADATTKVYAFRDTQAPNLAALTWSDIPDSDIKYLVGGAGSALQTAYDLDDSAEFTVLSERELLNTKNVITNPSANSDFAVSPGDIIVISILTGANKSTLANLYFSEQI